MSNNCLVTKLNGSVQNENLPVFDKLVLTLPVVSGGGNDSQKYFIFMAGSKPVKISANVLFGPAGAQVYEYTIPANGLYNGAFAELNGGKVTIDSVYNLKFYQCNANNILGGDSLEYGELLGAQYSWDSTFHGNVSQKLVNSGKLKYFRNSMSSCDLSKIKDTIEFTDILGPNTAGGYSFPNLKATYFIDCNINNLNIPNIEAMGLGDPSGVSGGSYTQLVNNLRAAGRTTGKMFVQNLFQTYTTIDNGSGVEISLRDYATQHSIDVSQSTDGVIEWTADSISASKNFSGVKTIANVNEEVFQEIRNTIL